jgi:hypothetical protein
MNDNDEPISQDLTKTDVKPVRERRISKRIAEVVRLLLTGECKTQKAAAERVGMNYTHVCEMMKKPHVRMFIERRTRETLADGSLRASARLVELLDASSEHVSFDASRHLLALNGHQPPSGPSTLVNLNVTCGYVIDLSPEPGELIDVTLTSPQQGDKHGR